MPHARKAVALLAGAWAMTLPAVPAQASTPASDNPGTRPDWGLTQIGAAPAWARTTGAGVRIGIIDTGVDVAHEDLASRVVAATACLGSAGDPARCKGSGEDDNGHGTHVAGVAAALRGNGRGIDGLAPDADLVVAKVTTASGAATVADVVAGIKWAVDHGARVVNLSLDDPALAIAPADPAAIREGLDYARSRGAVPVLSAGSLRRLGYALGERSARDLNAVVVGATGADRRMTAYSPPTGDARFAVLAPGGRGGTGPSAGVLSTTWAWGRHDAYAARAGTSAAAAYVSGALALLLAEGYNGLGAVERLLSTADGTVHCGQGSPSCYGLIDVAAATSGPIQQSSR